MNDKNLERAIELGKRVEVFSSLIGADNFPDVNCAREIEQVTDRDEGREIRLAHLCARIGPSVRVSTAAMMLVMMGVPVRPEGIHFSWKKLTSG